MLQKVVRAIDPDLPVSDVASMDTRIADSLVARRSPALLAALFSAIAVLLTAVGTYGVLSYSVAQRRREIGLRMALGARPEQICQQFVSLALWLFAIGTLLGVAGAWLTGQAMQTMLFECPGWTGRQSPSLRASWAWCRWRRVCCRRSAPPESRQPKPWQISRRVGLRGLCPKTAC